MFRACLGGSGKIGQRQRNAPEALEHDFLGRRGFDEGYHDITWRGMTLAKVFVKPTLAAQGSRQRHRLS